MPDLETSARRVLLLKLGAAAAVLAVAGILVVRGVDLKGLLDQGLALIRDAGPLAFFTAMTLGPACGVPMLAFSLPAVSLFGPRFGTVPVLLMALGAMTANFILTYALARRGLRPLLEAIVNRLGYKLPQVESGDAVDLVVLVRVTPGIPFFMQNYLAGLAQVPFGKYVVVSLIITWPINTAFMLFGDALLHGKGKLALLGLCAVLALSAGTHLVRKHYARRAAPPPPSP